jgi:hypothetical protein
MGRGKKSRRHYRQRLTRALVDRLHHRRLPVDPLSEFWLDTNGDGGHLCQHCGDRYTCGDLCWRCALQKIEDEQG